VGDIPQLKGNIMVENNRRMSDNQSLDISQMIADENDPKQRAFLIVLHSINLNLEANTRTITDIADKLDTHIQTFESRVNHEDKMINQGKGAWKIMAWLLGLAQIGAFGLWTNLQHNLTTLKDNNAKVVSELVQVRERVILLEVTKSK